MSGQIFDFRVEIVSRLHTKVGDMYLTTYRKVANINVC